MRRHRSRVGLMWLIGIACTALAWLIYEEISKLPSGEILDSASATLPSLAAPVPSQPVLAMPDKASLAVILERPVFSQTRRPSGAPAGAQATIDFTLSGVVISTYQRSALVQPGKAGIVQRLKEGDEIAGWTLIQITPDRIIVRRGAEEAEMLLNYAAPAPPVSSTPVPRTENRKENPTAKPATEEPAEQAPSQPANTEAEPEGGTQN